MNYQLTIILLISCALYSYGQQERNPKKGEIFEFQNPIFGVNIYNLNSKQGVSTSIEGKFEIFIKINDTLIISHVKYQTIRIIATEKHIEQESLKIHMLELTNYLNTVTLKNHDLTGNLNNDMKKLPKIPNRDSILSNFKELSKMISIKDYELNMEKPFLNNLDPTGGVGGSGITLSQGILSFHSKDLKLSKFKDVKLRMSLRSKRNTSKRIISDLGLNYFTIELKIPEDKIHHFLTYCNYKDIFNLYNKNEILKVLNILQEESVGYLQIED